MKNETDLQYIRRRLKETVGEHNTIAEKSKVPQSTISRIHLGAIPRLDTAIKLIKYLKKLEAAK
jgi:predicted transcriptional regulator